MEITEHDPSIGARLDDTFMILDILESTLTGCSQIHNARHFPAGVVEWFFEVVEGSPGKKRTTSINSCLCPVGCLDGASITTVEGIGNSKAGFNKVQGEHSFINRICTAQSWYAATREGCMHGWMSKCSMLLGALHAPPTSQHDPVSTRRFCHMALWRCYKLKTQVAVLKIVLHHLG